MMKNVWLLSPRGGEAMVQRLLSINECNEFEPLYVDRMGVSKCRVRESA